MPRLPRILGVGGAIGRCRWFTVKKPAIFRLKRAQFTGFAGLKPLRIPDWDRFIKIRPLEALQTCPFFQKNSKKGQHCPKAADVRQSPLPAFRRDTKKADRPARPAGQSAVMSLWLCLVYLHRFSSFSHCSSTYSCVSSIIHSFPGRNMCLKRPCLERNSSTGFFRLGS